MNLSHHRELIEKLAAEYVLGTLKGRARRRFEKLMQEDIAIAKAVDRWKDRLHPMAEYVKAETPRPQVWEAIARQTELLPKSTTVSSSEKRSWWLNLYDSLHFWRGLSMASMALASILAVFLVTTILSSHTPNTYVATLVDNNAHPIAVVSAGPVFKNLHVRFVNVPNTPNDRDLQLWAITNNGQARSLGLITQEGLSTTHRANLLDASQLTMLAISLEPKGGAPTLEAPTGPILFKGPWVAL